MIERTVRWRMRGERKEKQKEVKERKRVGQIIVLKEKNEEEREGGGVKEVRGYSGGLWLRR